MVQISVIIPTYKPGDYIFDCFYSLVNQTYAKEDFEVIVVLNGCDESDYIKIDSYLSKTKLQYSLFRSEVLGVSNARNIGLNYAKGKYISFIDDDDMISPQYLECLLKEGAFDTIVVSNVYTFVDNLNCLFDDYIGSSYKKMSEKKCLNLFEGRHFLSSACCKLIPAEIIGNRRFNVDFKRGEDALFMAVISDQIKSIRLASSEAIYYRRFRNQSASRMCLPKMEYIKEAFLLSKEFANTYFINPNDYHILFFISRILAPLKSLFINVIKPVFN